MMATVASAEAGQTGTESLGDDAAWIDGCRNAEWADTHAAELRAYEGQWVCVAEQRIVAANQDRRRISEQVRQGSWHGPGRAPYILYMPAAGEREPLRVATPFAAAPK